MSATVPEPSTREEVFTLLQERDDMEVVDFTRNVYKIIVVKPEGETEIPPEVFRKGCTVMRRENGRVYLSADF